jgi:hypothetical protein
MLRKGMEVSTFAYSHRVFVDSACRGLRFVLFSISFQILSPSLRQCGRDSDGNPHECHSSSYGAQRQAVHKDTPLQYPTGL